jgi:hypothetical protein
MDRSRFHSSQNYGARLDQQGQPINSVPDGSEQYEQSAQRAPPAVPFEQNQSDAFWHHQVSFQEPLSYGRSPNSLSSPSNSSVEQSTLGEPSQGSAFLPSRSHACSKPETKYCRVPAQPSFNPQILQDNSIAGTYIWPQNDGDNFLHSFVGPTVTPHRSGAAGSSSKRKRKPDVPSQVLLPYSHKEWQVVPQSSGAPYDRNNPVLCSRCNIYESLVSQPELNISN